MASLHKFKSYGKFLFIAAAFVCFFTIIAAPVGLVFLYMAFKAKIVMHDDKMVYSMLFTKEIPYKEIKKLKLSKPVAATHYAGRKAITLATVIPLIIEYAEGKRTKLSLNFFENSAGILEILTQKTGLDVEHS